MESLGLISVIVPVYNREKTLRRCVDSILSQLYTDFEILLVDDGSTDASGQILDEYAARDVRCKVFHKSNGGVSSARNLGLEHMNAESRFIVFCDSDDWVADTWLLDYVLNYNGEDVIFQNAKWYGKDRVLEKDVVLPDDAKLAEKIKILYDQFVLPYIWSGMWRAGIIRKFRLRFGDYTTMEDIIWAADYCHHIHSVSIIPPQDCHQYGYHYYFPWQGRSYSRVTEKWFRTKMDLLERMDSLFNTLDAPDLFEDINRSISSDIMVSLMNLYRGRNTNVCSKRERIRILNLVGTCKVRMEFVHRSFVWLYGHICQWKHKDWADAILLLMAFLLNFKFCVSKSKNEVLI